MVGKREGKAGENGREGREKGRYNCEMRLPSWISHWNVKATHIIY